MASRGPLFAVVAGVAVIVALFLWRGLPYLTQDRLVPTATPSPPGIFSATDVRLPAGRELCWDLVAFEPATAQAQVIVGTFGRPGPPLRATVRAPGGFRSTSTIRGGYGDNQPVAIPIRPPERDALGELCLRNEGRRPIALRGTNEPRTQSPPTPKIDGRPVDADVMLLLYERDNSSYLANVGGIIEHVGAFRTGLIGPVTLWPLLLLVGLGIPAGILFALYLALRKPDGPPAA